MENESRNQVPSWNDLVFENRNKAFGAYCLRNEYPTNVISALLISATMATIIAMLPMILALIGFEKKVVAKIPVIARDFAPLTEPIIMPKERPTKPKQLANKKTVNLAPVVTSAPVEDTIIPNEPSPITTESAANVTLANDLPIPMETPIPMEPKIVYVFAEKMPAYEGGLEGLYKFLAKNLRYPAIDRRNGTEGTVYVQFIIDEIGHVTNVEVFKGINETLDREAVRVISSMKSWTPGSQNHQAVSIKMILPIKFKLTT